MERGRLRPPFFCLGGDYCCGHHFVMLWVSTDDKRREVYGGLVEDQDRVCHNRDQLP